MLQCVGFEKFKQVYVTAFSTRWSIGLGQILSCWGWPSLLNCIGALTLSLLLKLPPRKSGFPTGVENMAGGSSKFDGGCLSQYMGGSMGGLKCCQKYLWRSSFDSKVAGYKPASLQIY